MPRKRRPGRPSTGKTTQLQIRIRPDEKRNLERAATASGQTMSEFVLAAALEKAKPQTI